MAALNPHLVRMSAVLLTAALALIARATPAQVVLPWEITVAEIEAGRLRNLAERLSKQNLLYQLRLGDVRKVELVETASQVDGILRALQQGSPSHSVPRPFTSAIKAQLRKTDAAWGPLRRIAVATPYDQLRVSREFIEPADRRGDPLLIRYFDDLTQLFLKEVDVLLRLYNDACIETGLEICQTARESGYVAMLIERATKQAVYVVAGIEVEQNKRRLRSTVRDYLVVREANDQSPFYGAALDPERGPSARAARELLASLREDWDALEVQVGILAAGDERNFDLDQLLAIQTRLVDKVERLTAALVRYASFAYGS